MKDYMFIIVPPGFSLRAGSGAKLGDKTTCSKVAENVQSNLQTAK